MKRHAAIVMLAAAFIGTAQAGRAAALKVGERAPNFALRDQSGKLIRLSDYHGKTVVLAFYVLAFTGG